MKLELFNTNQIESLIKRDKEEFDSGNNKYYISPISRFAIDRYGELNAENYLKMFKSMCILPQTKARTKTILKNLLEFRYMELDDEDLETVNKLIGDTKLHDKFVLVTDGSYLNNRICLFDDGSIIIEMTNNSLFNYVNTKMSIKDKINWIYNHYDKIFIQFVELQDDFDY